MPSCARSFWFSWRSSLVKSAAVRKRLISSSGLSKRDMCPTGYSEAGRVWYSRVVSETGDFGKYRLIRRIASGGMAEIFLATADGPAGFQKSVCIKRILPHLSQDQTFVDMLITEARLGARLSHPN